MILRSLLCLTLVPASAFVTRTPSSSNHQRRWVSLAAKAVGEMRVGEIKKELESYGISTRSFLEKSELVEALQDARDKGFKPKETSSAQTTSSSTSSSSSTSTSSSRSSSSEEKNDSRPRQERLAEEFEKCMTMKAGELKKELQSLGVSTASFFEKSEFAKALAEARVDGVKSKEGYAEYAEVEVLTDDASGPRKKQSEQSSKSTGEGSPFGGGGSPFGGGASPFGGGGASPFGGGGAGVNIADLLKNMGGGAAAAGGANPFGGMGGNPFGGGANPFGGMGGDAMGKAQQMMSNPKVQELMAKAQSNPALLKKMTEVMGNPAAFAKYQNDPDVAELMKELKKCM